MKTSISEVTQIREQIAAEQMAGRLGLHGLNAGMARHAFITAKQERVAVLHGKLQELVGDVATAMVVETCDSLPDTLARADVLAVLRHEFSNEEVEPLCTSLQEVWRTLDMLKDRFGVETARKLLLAPSSSLVRETPPS